MGNCVSEVMDNIGHDGRGRHSHALGASTTSFITGRRCPLKALRIKAIDCNDRHFVPCLLVTGVVSALIGALVHWWL